MEKIEEYFNEELVKFQYSGSRIVFDIRDLSKLQTFYLGVNCSKENLAIGLINQHEWYVTPYEK